MYYKDKDNDTNKDKFRKCVNPAIKTFEEIKRVY